MTNTLNTPIEALEFAFPMRVRRYAIRRGSGGEGFHAGGDGIVREIEFLAPGRLTLISERRSTSPYGLAGGGDGTPGRSMLRRAGQSGEGEELPAKAERDVAAGDMLRLETPGGGAWGAVP